MSLQVTNKAAMLFFIVDMFSLKKLSSPTAGAIYVYPQKINTTKDQKLMSNSISSTSEDYNLISLTNMLCKLSYMFR